MLASAQATDSTAMTMPVVVGAAPHGALHIGGQEADHAGQQGPDRQPAEIAGRDDPVAQEPERHDRLAAAPFVHHQPDQRHGAADQQRRDDGPVERFGLHHHHHDGADAEHQQCRSEVVDVVLARIEPLMEKDRQDRDRPDADRQIDPEHEGPMQVLHDEGAEHRPDHRRQAPHARQPALQPRPVGRRIDVADDGGGDRLDGAGAHALQGAERDQRHHAGGEAAGGRADEENAGARRRTRACGRTGPPAARRSGWSPPGPGNRR